MNHELAIIGISVSIIGVIITLLLYRKVKNIEDSRRNEQKTHFKKLIISNIEEVLDIYQSASVLSHRQTFTDQETHEKTIALHNFFKKNKENILRLVRDTKFYASMLSVVDTPSIDMDEVIEKIKWLHEDFYILDYPIKRNERLWIGKEQELRDNRDFIECSLTSLHNL